MPITDCYVYIKQYGLSKDLSLKNNLKKEKKSYKKMVTGLTILK